MMKLKKFFFLLIMSFFSTASFSASMNMIGEKGDPNKVDRTVKIKTEPIYNIMKILI